MPKLVKPDKGIDGLLNDIERVARKVNDYTPEYDPDDPPGAPTNVTLDFRVRETRAGEIIYIGIGDCDVLAPGLCEADIGYYIARLRAVDSTGTPIPGERVKRDLYLVSNPDDLNPESLKFFFNDLDHPRKWYYQLSVAIVNKANIKGEWSDWTTPQLPHSHAKPSPPVPQNLAVSFDKNEKDRSEPRWRLLATCDEIPFWDIKPKDPTEKVTQNLNGAITAGATTLTLGSTTGFPTPVNKERVTLRVGHGEDREVISYNDKTSTQLQGVKRGLDGTTAKAWPDNTDVIMLKSDAQDRENDLVGYDCQIRRVNASGDWILDSNGKFIQRTQSKSWDKEDDDNDGKVRFVFPNIRKRHKWKVRVRSRARGNMKGDWSDWFPSGATYASPIDTDDPPLPTNLVQDVDPRKINLMWDAPDDPDDTDSDPDGKAMHHDIAYFQVQVSDRADFNKSLSNFWRSDRYHKTTHKTFRKKKTARGPFYSRVRSVDGSDNKSAWVTTSKGRKRPGKVRNRSVEGKTRAVKVKFDPPNAWEDGTTDEWDTSEVSHYEVYLYRNGVLFDQDLHVLSTRKSFPVTKAESSGSFSTVIRAVGHEADYATEDPATGSATPEGVTVGPGEIENGAINSNLLYGSQVGAIWRASTPPSSPKNGDLWYDEGTIYRKLYRYSTSTVYVTTYTESGSPQQTVAPQHPSYPGWYTGVDGADILANNIHANSLAVGSLSAISADLGTINAGTLNAVVINGGIINTGQVLRFQLFGADTSTIGPGGGSGETYWTGQGFSPQLWMTGFSQGVKITHNYGMNVDNVRPHNDARVSFPQGLGIPSGAYIRFNDTVVGAGAKTAEDRWVSVETPAGVKWLRCFS